MRIPYTVPYLSTTQNKTVKTEANSAILQTADYKWELALSHVSLSKVRQQLYSYVRNIDRGVVVDFNASFRDTIYGHVLRPEKIFFIHRQVVKVLILFTVYTLVQWVTSIVLSYQVLGYLHICRGGWTEPPRDFLNCSMTWAGSQIPESNFSISDPRSKVKLIPDPASKNLNNFKPKTISKLSEKLSGMFIPDSDFFSIPDPWVEKAPDPDPEHLTWETKAKWQGDGRQ